MQNVQLLVIPALIFLFVSITSFLKAVHVKKIRYSLLNSVKQFWTAYNAHVTWESVAELEKRVCTLLPALMLARIDGKSPVEYLGDSDRTLVRSMAISLIKYP